ncbi:MAG: transporter [Alphaproteobacteria bacterium]
MQGRALPKRERNADTGLIALSARRRRAGKVATLVCITALAASPPAKALDNAPGDYEPLPDGSNIAQVSFRYGNSTHLHLKDVGNVPDSSMTSKFAIGRMVHYEDVGGIILSPQIIVPYGTIMQAKIGGQKVESAIGFGDPLLACQFGLLNQPRDHRYIGIGTGIFVPVGTYHKGDTLNVGENRWKGVLQVGFVQGLVDGFTLDLTVDATFYGDNSEAGTGRQTLSQERSHQVQPWLRYALTPKSTIAVGYSKTFGGTQKLDDVANGFQTNAQQIRLEYQHLLTSRVMVVGQAARDVAVTGGFNEDFRGTLRIGMLF